MTMGKNRWDERKTALLAETYPVETTAYTAGVVGMSETAVKNKARKMGIVKVAKSGWLERAEHIKSHFHEKSFSEMGRELGISKMSVSRIAAKLIGTQVCQIAGFAEMDFDGSKAILQRKLLDACPFQQAFHFIQKIGCRGGTQIRVVYFCFFHVFLPIYSDSICKNNGLFPY